MTLHEGILLVDKNVGSSSFSVLRKIKRILGKIKIGHAGTLDPFATGLLVILLGKYTRVATFCLTDEKEYEATFFLGRSTTTDDSEGETIDECVPPCLQNSFIEENLKSFLGEYLQTPPIFSAVHVGGTRAYKLARKKEEIILKV